MMIVEAIRSKGEPSISVFEHIVKGVPLLSRPVSVYFLGTSPDLMHIIPVGFSETSLNPGFDHFQDLSA